MDRSSSVRAMIAEVARRRPDLKAALESDTWGYDRTWMVGDVLGAEERGLPVRSWTDKYLTSMSLGPWRVVGQVRQKNLVLASVGDREWSTIDSRHVKALPFVLAWQHKLAETFHAQLKNASQTIDQLCADLRDQTGDRAYCRLAELHGVESYSKCLDFFVREALELDTVPIDRRVRRLLKEFGLDRVKSSELTGLIRQAGYAPRWVARVLYEAGGPPFALALGTGNR